MYFDLTLTNNAMGIMTDFAILFNKNRYLVYSSFYSGTSE